MVITTLAHHVDVHWMYEAYRRTRKNGAAGIDGKTAADFEENLEENLKVLVERLKSGRFRVPPVKRVHIPKGDGRTRPIGIPTFEDKVLQRSVAMLLEPILEEDFCDFSFGFRPGRSAHQAIHEVWKCLMDWSGGVVLEVDFKGYFDTIDHGILRGILDQRVKDGVVRRMLDKWLKAGVMEDGAFSSSEMGTPQGGVISPLLANLYLHEAMDKWFVSEVKPRMRGSAEMFRFADDLIMVFQVHRDAERVLSALHKRAERFGLTLHPDKTRLTEFEKPRGRKDPGNRPGTFDFLGFTFYWGKSRKGRRVVKKKTRKARLKRSIGSVGEWLARNRHKPIPDQRRELAAKLRGHYGYYGIVGNYPMMNKFLAVVKKLWWKWLNRRGQRRSMTWSKYWAMLDRHRLPPPRITHPEV